MKEFSRIIVIICFTGFFFVGGAVLWASMVDHSVSQTISSLFLTSSISAVLGGFIGYRVSRLIK